MNILAIWIECLLIGLIAGIVNYKLHKFNILWGVIGGIIVAILWTFKYH